MSQLLPLPSPPNKVLIRPYDLLLNVICKKGEKEDQRGRGLDPTNCVW